MFLSPIKPQSNGYSSISDLLLGNYKSVQLKLSISAINYYGPNFIVAYGISLIVPLNEQSLEPSHLSLQGTRRLRLSPFIEYLSQYFLNSVVITLVRGVGCSVFGFGLTSFNFWLF